MNVQPNSTPSASRLFAFAEIWFAPPSTCEHGHVAADGANGVARVP